MARTSPTKKVTKVARTGGGRTKRGGQATSWFFPTFVGVVAVIGLALTIYSREQRQPDTSPPRIGRDHWHSAIGFNLCGNFAPPIPDNGRDPLGIHGHGDGVVHTHPFSSQAAGKNARLQHFLDTLDIKVTADSIQLPDGEPFENGTMCGDKPGRVVTKVWQTRAPEDQGEVVSGDPRRIRLGNNQLITVAFLPEGQEIPKPPSETQLDNLTDVGPTADATTTTAPGETTTSVTATTTTAPAPAAP